MSTTALDPLAGVIVAYMDNRICCVACTESSDIVIVVRDPGEGFALKDVRNPLAAENLHSTHGRGIYLINQLMDEVSFERKGAEICMRKTVAASAPGVSGAV